MERYISIKEVLDNLLDNPLLQNLTLERVVNYTVDFIRKVGMPKLYIEKTAKLEIKDYRALLPCDFYKVIQVRACKNGYNQTFRSFYTGVMAIAVTLFALFIIWKFVNKLLDPDEETTFKTIIMEIVKCGTLIMMSTFLFVQVSNFSITLSNYTGNIFVPDDLEVMEF